MVLITAELLLRHYVNNLFAPPPNDAPSDSVCGARSPGRTHVLAGIHIGNDIKSPATIASARNAFCKYFEAICSLLAAIAVVKPSGSALFIDSTCLKPCDGVWYPFLMATFSPIYIFSKIKSSSETTISGVYIKSLCYIACSLLRGIRIYI